MYPQGHVTYENTKTHKVESHLDHPGDYIYGTEL